jgi:inosine-uridine nucleoside N-ribohydrolase
MYVDVDTTYGPNYGKSFGYRANERRDLRRPSDFPDGAQRVKVLLDIDRKAFWELFVKLMRS